MLVCHAPSRYGGEKETESARECLASTIRAITDSLHQMLPRAQILLMGDFNDTPDHRTIQQTLGALPLSKISSDTTAYLINLFDGKRAYAMGSHKYNSFWSQLDQLILSRNLVDSNAPFYYEEGSAHIFAPDFLLKSDPTHGGKRPFRTYYGFRYEGGFSDHLPVIADFLFRKDVAD